MQGDSYKFYKKKILIIRIKNCLTNVPCDTLLTGQDNLEPKRILYNRGFHYRIEIVRTFKKYKILLLTGFTRTNFRVNYFY